jgi:hypothetical protein
MNVIKRLTRINRWFQGNRGETSAEARNRNVEEERAKTSILRIDEEERRERGVESTQEFP